jgi:hypothetical protein
MLQQVRALIRQSHGKADGCGQCSFANPLANLEYDRSPPPCIRRQSGPGPRIEPENKACQCCGGALPVIGEDISKRFDVVPAQLRVIETRRPKYACRSCEKDGADNVGGPGAGPGKDLSIEVEAGTSRITLVYGRIDLDEIIIAPDVDMAAACRNYTRRDSAAATKGVADSNHPIADTGSRSASSTYGKLMPIHFE